MVVTKNEFILLSKEINAEFERLQKQIDALVEAAKPAPKTKKETADA